MKTSQVLTGLILTLLLLSMSPGSASCAVRHVEPNGIDDAGRDGLHWNTAFATISYAVERAVAGDTILVSNGVYNVASTINIDKHLSIESLNGAEYTILDGGGEASGSFRAFGTGAASLTVTLRGLTIADFHVVGHGTIHVSSGSTWHIYDCIIKDNYVTGNGGGIYAAASSPLYISGTQISSNTAAVSGLYSGGGVWVMADGVAEVKNCRIIGNRAPLGRGGGIGSFNAASMNVELKLKNCFISENMAHENGGGVAANGVDVLVSSCFIVNNESTSSGHGGGGIKLWRGTIESSVIAENESNGRGGGANLNHYAVMRNCTVVYNISRHIYPRAGINASRTPSETNTIVNSIVYFNETGAGAVSNYGTTPCFGSP